jgi:hypothetical protein
VKVLAPSGLDPRLVQPVASRYTPAHNSSSSSSIGGGGGGGGGGGAGGGNIIISTSEAKNQVF